MTVNTFQHTAKIHFPSVAIGYWLDYKSKGANISVGFDGYEEKTVLVEK